MSSVVQFSGRLGRVNFAIVWQLHKPFVRTMLRNALRTEAHTRANPCAPRQ